MFPALQQELRAFGQVIELQVIVPLAGKIDRFFVNHVDSQMRNKIADLYPRATPQQRQKIFEGVPSTDARFTKRFAYKIIAFNTVTALSVTFVGLTVLGIASYNFFTAVGIITTLIAREALAKTIADQDQNRPLNFAKYVVRIFKGSEAEPQWASPLFIFFKMHIDLSTAFALFAIDMQATMQSTR